MKKVYLVIQFFIALSFNGALAQEIQTIFKGPRSSGGYAAISNKFTTIGGEYANMPQVYGGWYINHRFLIGLGFAGSTNFIRVPEEFSVYPGSKNVSYGYGQAGLMTEYVIGSNKALHLVLNLFSGAGFSYQYLRYRHNYGDDYDPFYGNEHDENFFFVLEPGAQIEINVFRWMRFSPGVSYRKAFGSDAAGLTDEDLTNLSYNVTLKFGKF